MLIYQIQYSIQQDQVLLLLLGHLCLNHYWCHRNQSNKLLSKLYLLDLIELSLQNLDFWIQTWLQDSKPGSKHARVLGHFIRPWSKALGKSKYAMSTGILLSRSNIQSHYVTKSCNTQERPLRNPNWDISLCFDEMCVPVYNAHIL